MASQHDDMGATVDAVMSEPDGNATSLVHADWSRLNTTEDMKSAAKTILISAGQHPTHEAIANAIHQMLAGRELGLSPLASVRLVSVNVEMKHGKARVTTILSAQMMAGLVRKAGWSMSLGYGDNPLSATVTLRRGDEVIEETWSEEDAKRAGLWGKGVSWPKYPKQMLRWRAVADAARVAVPELLAGVYAHEELNGGFDSVANQQKATTGVDFDSEFGGDQ